jgi:hypothetical protein
MVDAGLGRIAKKNDAEFFAANFCARTAGDVRHVELSRGVRQPTSVVSDSGQKTFICPRGAGVPFSRAR